MRPKRPALPPIIHTTSAQHRSIRSAKRLKVIRNTKRSIRAGRNAPQPSAVRRTFGLYKTISPIASPRSEVLARRHYLFCFKGTFHMAQTDITPVTNPALGGGTQPNGIHLHSPNGVSAASYNNPADPLASMPVVKAATLARKTPNGISRAQI